MRTWIAWAVIALAIVALSENVFDRILRNAGTLSADRDPADPSTVIFTWHGPVEHPMAEKVASAFGDWRDTTNRIVLRLDSNGGLVDHGRRVIAVLRYIKRTHRLDTAVESGDHCASMCVPIFLEGEDRMAGGRSHWLFHQVQIHDRFDDKRMQLSDRERAAITAEFFEEHFVPAGVDRAWIAHLQPQMANGTDVWLTGRELLQARTGIVTNAL